MKHLDLSSTTRDIFVIIFRVSNSGASHTKYFSFLVDFDLQIYFSRFKIWMAIKYSGGQNASNVNNLE